LAFRGYHKYGKCPQWFRRIDRWRAAAPPEA